MSLMQICVVDRRALYLESERRVEQSRHYEAVDQEHPNLEEEGVL
jgi:hypothetical protein